MNDGNLCVCFNVVFFSAQVSTTSSHGIRMNIPKVSSWKPSCFLRSNPEFLISSAVPEFKRESEFVPKYDLTAR